MARRGAKPPKTKPIRKTRARGGDTGFEVTEDTGEQAPEQAMTLESGLVIVTFLALVLALVLIEVEYSAAFGAFWPLG